jgi:hypothetical protein
MVGLRNADRSALAAMIGTLPNGTPHPPAVVASPLVRRIAAGSRPVNNENHVR